MDFNPGLPIVYVTLLRDDRYLYRYQCAVTFRRIHRLLKGTYSEFVWRASCACELLDVIHRRSIIHPGYCYNNFTDSDISHCRHYYQRSRHVRDVRSFAGPSVFQRSATFLTKSNSNSISTPAILCPARFDSGSS